MIDALRLATALLFLCISTRTERAAFLFQMYDHCSEKKLSELQVRFLIKNCYFLVANALPALFVPKERNGVLIRN